MPDNSIPTFEPDSITAGDTASWRRSFTLYSAGGGWVLSYSMRMRNSGVVEAFSSTADEDTHLVNVLPTVTAVWPAGDYDVQAYVTKSPDRYQVWNGKITVQPNFAGTYPINDTRTHARIVLDNLNAVLEQRATDDILNSTIEGTIIFRLLPEQLMLLHDRYTVKVQKEERIAKRNQGRKTGRRILTAFVRP
jgi:hypothetical protein